MEDNKEEKEEVKKRWTQGKEKKYVKEKLRTKEYFWRIKEKYGNANEKDPVGETENEKEN